MKPLERILEAATRNPRHIVLSEGEDPRIVEGACRAVRDGLATITFLGKAGRVAERIAEQGGDGLAGRLLFEDPAASPRAAAYAAAYHALRAGKGISLEEATRTIATPLAYAAMMVRQGDAEGTVGGAVATTADTVRTALQIIGRAPGSRLVSSFFIMMLCEPHHPKKGAFVFADCGLVVEPTVEELADIAVNAARSCRTLLDTEPRVAMLSFSTFGSAAHERVSRVVEATRLAHAAEPDIVIEGEIQFDAAFVESIGASKAPGSALMGAANVFIFPNLESANIGYKIAQRIGGARAIGPVLQGLARPANDLSRGCSAEDVYHMIAVTCVQAQKV